MRDAADLERIVNENIGTRGDDFPGDLTPSDWDWIYEAIDSCDMCGHWEDKTEFDERNYCGRCQCHYPEEEES